MFFLPSKNMDSRGQNGKQALTTAYDKYQEHETTEHCGYFDESHLLFF